MNKKLPEFALCSRLYSIQPVQVLKRLAALLAVLFLSLHAAVPVAAQNASPYELIDLTNQWRASYGNAPLITDPILMATAQATAETMAAMKACGHLGDVRGRIKTAGFGGGATVFATENIACGSTMDASGIVYQIWGDEIHMMPVTGVNYTHIGAGVAVDSEGFAYYVLHAAYTAGNPGVRPGVTASPGAVYDTPAPIERYVVSVKKADPQPDGSLVHEVGYGQTLWGIADAYGVKLEDITNLNPIIADDLVIYEGQKLLVALAVATLTPTPLPTGTSAPATSTPQPSVTPRPSSTAVVILTSTAAVSPTESPLPVTEKSETRKIVGIIILALCAVGLGLMIVSGFLKKD